MMKLFDAHCHLQDPRIFDSAPEIIRAALLCRILYLAVNGITENDWDKVKQMGEQYPSVIPNYGLHPWYVVGRSPNWLESLRRYIEDTPAAAIGEIGLDRSPLAKGIDYQQQLEVFKPQLELAKEIGRPVSVHCLDAFDDLIPIMQDIGPFPAGVILHSYSGSAEIVPKLAELGAYFSFSGHNMNADKEMEKQVLKLVPLHRILLETDSPDGLPNNMSHACCASRTSSMPTNQTYNQPSNVHIVLNYIASLLEMPKEELAQISYSNSIRLFSYPGSKVCKEH
ncbi:hypothetical protein MRB53_032375 [Persea americana]|uniref:Uncharacterized protein n=1 Tax=Persea americana TaxID=3435 RepID=A0ACC2KS20_PERAE|nr:hypothetical protein MRB53_032375 [Persea americana]